MFFATCCLLSKSATLSDRAAGAGVVGVEDSTAHHLSHLSQLWCSLE